MILLLIALGIHSLHADKLDSLLNQHDTLDIPYFQSSIDSLSLAKLKLVNPTRLAGFQQYDPLQQDNRFFATLGNLGLAHNPLIFNPFICPGVHFGMHSFDQYIYLGRKATYYRNQIPVSYLSYANGAHKEQFIRIVHSQPMGKNIILGADLYFLHSPGHYSHQKADDKSLVITGQFLTNNMRYGIIANYFHNKFIVEENGGIVNDSVFEENLDPNRRNIPVNLSTAENEVKVSGAFLNQYFFLSGSELTKDTNKAIRSKRFHLGRIAHKFDYTKQIQMYSDKEPTNSFWEPFDDILDSTQTFDSVRVDRLTNQISWSNLGINDNPLDKRLYINIGITYQYSRISGYSEKQDYHIFMPSGDVSTVPLYPQASGYNNKRTYNTLIPSVEITIRPSTTTKLDLTGKYTFGDFNSGGYYLGGKFKQYLRFHEKNFGALEFNAYLTMQEKGYFYHHYFSNYLRWNNDLKQEKILFIDGSYILRNLRIGASLYQVADLIYLNENAKPQQHDGSISIFQAYLYKNFRLGIWNIDNTFIYQHASDNNILRLPDLTARISFYVTLSLFKNALILQPGLDFNYNTAYYGDAYMPATRSFYLQNDKKIGNYVYADVYVNFMIKRFRFFLKYQHFNSFFSGYRYYMVPHYPAQDAALKFGLSWTFYN